MRTHSRASGASASLWPAVLAVPLWLACSDGAAERDAGPALADARIVPEGLSVSALPGGSGVLELVALTVRPVRQGAAQLEVYAAVANRGDVAACSAALSVELFDEAGRSLGAGIGGLPTERFYRRTDGSDAIAACVAPGEISMAAITDFAADIALEEVAQVVYRCPYFALDVVPIEGLTLSDVRRVARDGGTAFTGVLHNGLERVLRNPSVTVFPVNRVGRPLGAVIASDSVQVAPGGRWVFETRAVDAGGVDHRAYPAGALEGAATEARP